MPYSAKMFKRLDELEPKVKKVMLDVLEEIEKNTKESVKREDFNDLKKIVARLADAQEQTARKLIELAEAQKRTEQRVEELAEAQKRTEQRMDSLSQKVEALAEAQKRTEQRVEELAEAQKRTEQRMDSLSQKVEELAEAQKRTEQRVEELAEAQKKTEEVVRQLVTDMSIVKKQLGGLSHAVGYGIEDRIIPLMDAFVEKEYGFVPDEVERKFIQYDSKHNDEVNIFIKGIKNEQSIVVIGECKSQPGKADIDDFGKMAKRLKSFLNTEIQGFIVGYIFDPEVEEYIKQYYPDIKYYKTYQIERIAKGK